MQIKQTSLRSYWAILYSDQRIYLSHSITKPTKWHVRPAKTQISLNIRPVWSESLLCVLMIAKELMLLYADAKADLSRRWAHVIVSLCWFWHAEAHFYWLIAIMQTVCSLWVYEKHELYIFILHNIRFAGCDSITKIDNIALSKYLFAYISTLKGLRAWSFDFDTVQKLKVAFY